MNRRKGNRVQAHFSSQEKVLAKKRAFPIRLWVVHPFLFAVFPILFLYARNSGHVSIDEIAVPIALSIAFSLVLWILLSLVLRNTAKAGLATSLFIFMFFSYGRVYGLLEDWGVFVPKHAHLLPLALLLFGYAVYFIRMARTIFANTTKILNIVALLLILINLASIAVSEITSPKSSPLDVDPSDARAASTDNLVQLGALPDIYIIIIDEYAHPGTMAEYYGYDNTAFVESLSQMGFFVAHNSEATSFWSYRAIPSLLNMEYLKGVPGVECFQKITNNQVVNFLHSYGYKYVYFGSWYELGRWEIDADVYYNFYDLTGGMVSLTEFRRTLVNTTMLLPFYDYLVHDHYNTYYRRGVLDTLEQLAMMPSVPGPKFIFAHVMCPHDPFVFGPDGEEIDHLDRCNYVDKQIYLGQYVYITQEIQELVSGLLEKSDTPPVIVLQSDHGLRVRPERGLDIPSDEYRRILNAYYMPDGGTAQLYDSISPVNTFRVIFNHYFNAGYALLED